MGGNKKHGSFVDNLEAAVYAMVNELARRHDIRPCDFRAEFREHEPRMCHALAFTWPAAENADMERRYRAMLRNIGIGPETQELVGNADAIYASLEHALNCVPARSRRGR